MRIIVQAKKGCIIFPWMKNYFLISGSLYLKKWVQYELSGS